MRSADTVRRSLLLWVLLLPSQLLSPFKVLEELEERVQAGRYGISAW